ncbi:MarP family serine protease [Catellatospora citrea]|uniref:Serine protease n=1 Tax=Catellatospora citrea TaxID=53366 RepID=A0A8J3KUJ0_9ACTN|nr:MarP family serine protease [Catellatospora citrea]RKE08672.1 colicin V production protein [Catellatospora citrea]GIG01500.1 serine protease [Catellatospora citrea]
MSVVDGVLIILLLLFGVSGYRQGFVVGVLSFIGFFGGALIGLQLGPLLAGLLDDAVLKLVVSLIAVFGLAVLGQSLAGWWGGKLRRAITNRAGQTVDDLGGAVVSVLAVSLVAWLVAVPLSDAAQPGLAKAVRSSSLLAAIDSVMPGEAKALTEALRDTVDTNGFPEVFGDLVPTQVKEVPAPDPKLKGSQVVLNAKKSVVKVLGNAPSCSRRIEGSGFVFADEHVMTNAHVVAGTKTIRVELNGSRLQGTVVVYDPERDLAVIHVPSLNAPVMRFANAPAKTGADAIVLGFPLDGPYDAQSARVRDVGDITGPDIYEDGTVTREVYTIRGLVRSGNSGGPLVAADGSVLGVIFAAAADDPNVGYAVTADEASTVALMGRTRTRAVGTGKCA